MIPAHGEFEIALPNSYGFTFQKVKAIDFFNITTILEYVLTVNEYKPPSEVLAELHLYAIEDPYIFNRLGAINIRYNGEFAKVADRILDLSKTVKDDFFNWKKVLPLRFLNFNYEEFKSMCKSLFKKENIKETIFPKGSEDIMFELFKKALNFSKICYSNDGNITFVDSFGFNINTNEKVVTCNNEIEYNFAEKSSEIKQQILNDILMRPDIIQYLHEHHYELTQNYRDEQMEMELEYNRKQTTYEEKLVTSPLVSPEEIKKEEIINDFIESNKKAIDEVHDNMIKFIIKIIDETVDPSKIDSEIKKLNEYKLYLEQELEIKIKGNFKDIYAMSEDTPEKISKEIEKVKIEIEKFIKIKKKATEITKDDLDILGSEITELENKLEPLNNEAEILGITVKKLKDELIELNTPIENVEKLIAQAIQTQDNLNSQIKENKSLAEKNGYTFVKETGKWVLKDGAEENRAGEAAIDEILNAENELKENGETLNARKKELEDLKNEKFQSIELKKKELDDKNVELSYKNNVIKKILEELAAKQDDFFKKSNEYYKIALLQSFGESLKKLDRNMHMDNGVKRAVYNYFDLNNKVDLDYGLLEDAEKSELSEIDSVCNPNGDKSADEQRKDVIELYKKTKFSDNFLIKYSKLLTPQDINIQVNFGDSEYRKLNLPPKKEDVYLSSLKEKFDKIKEKNILIEHNVNNFESGSVEIKCYDSDVSLMKEYIKLKYEIFKRIKVKIANNYYDYINNNVKIYEGFIKSRTDGFVSELNDLIKEAKARKQIRNPIPGPEILLGDGKTYKDYTNSPEQTSENSKVRATSSDNAPISNQTKEVKGEGEGKGENLVTNPEQANARREQLANDVKNLEKREEKIAADEKLNEEEKQSEAETEQNRLKNAYLFGGNDDFVGKMFNMFKGFAEKNKIKTTGGKTYGDMTKLETEDTSNPFEDNLKWCKERATYWYMSGNEIKVNSAGESAGLKAEDFYRCMQKSYFKSVADFICNSMIKATEVTGDAISAAHTLFCTVLESLYWLICTWPANPLVYVCPVLWGIKTAFCNQGAKALLVSMFTCFPMWVNYFVSVALNDVPDKPYFGVTILRLVFLHVGDTVNKYYNNSLIGSGKKVICDMALRRVGINGIDQLHANLRNKIKDGLCPIDPNTKERPNYCANFEESNFFMYINIGLLDKRSGKNENDPTRVAEVLAEMMSNINDKQRENIDKLGKIVFNNDCSVYSNYNIVDALIAQMLNPTNVTLLMNVIFCNLFGIPPPTTSDLWSVSWWASFLYKMLFLLFSDKFSSQILTPMFQYILERPKLTDYLLTQIFGNSSYEPNQHNSQNGNEVNINVGRDVINKAVDDLYSKATVNGKIDVDKLKKVVEIEITGVFYSFFKSFFSNIYEFFKKSQDQQIPPFEFEALKDFNNQCIKNKCSSGDSTVDAPINFKEHMKEYLRRAICEIMQNPKLGELIIKKPEDKFLFFDKIYQPDKDPIKIFCNNDGSEFYKIYDGTTDKNTKFKEYLIGLDGKSGLLKRLKDAKYDDYLLSTFSLLQLDNSTKDRVQTDYVKKYFVGLSKMINTYIKFRPPSLKEAKLQEFLKKQIDDNKGNGEYTKGIYQYLEKHVFNQENIDTNELDIQRYMNEILIYPCDNKKRLVEIPIKIKQNQIVDGKEVEMEEDDIEYDCVDEVSDKYNEEQDKMEKTVLEGLAKEKKSNQIEIIKNIFSLLKTKISEYGAQSSKKTPAENKIIIEEQNEMLDKIRQLENILKLDEIQDLTSDYQIKKLQRKIIEEINEIYNKVSPKRTAAIEDNLRRLDINAFVEQVKNINKEKLERKEKEKEKDEELLQEEKIANDYPVQKLMSMILEENISYDPEERNKLDEIIQLQNNLYLEDDKTDIKSKTKNIVDKLKKFINDLLENKKITIEMQTKMMDLVNKITDKNVLSKKVSQKEGESLWKFYTPEDVPDFSEEKAREIYIENLLRNYETMFKTQKGEINYDYLIYVYLKNFIPNNVFDYYDHKMKLIRLLKEFNNNPKYAFTPDDINTIVPFEDKLEPVYNILKTKLFNLFKSDKEFREKLLSNLLIQQDSLTVGPRYLKPDRYPRVEITSVETEHTEERIQVKNVEKPIDLFIEPYKEEFEHIGESEIKNDKFDNQLTIIKKANELLDVLKYGLERGENGTQNKLDGVGGFAIVPTNDGNFSLIPMNKKKDISKFHYSMYKQQKLVKNEKDVDFESLESKYDTYENFLLGKKSSETMITWYDWFAGKSPDISDLRITMGEYENGFPPIITDFNSNLESYLKVANFSSETLLKNYKKVEITDATGEKKCLWLLKIDVEHLSNSFENFNVTEYAKKILKMCDEKSKIIEDVKKDSGKLAIKTFTTSLFGSRIEMTRSFDGEYLNDVVKYIESKGMKFTYFEDLKITGIDDDDAPGKKVSFAYLKDKYKDILTEEDLNKFIINLIPMSMLYGRNGYDAGGGLQLVVNISNDASKPVEVNDEMRDANKFSNSAPRIAH